MQFRSYIAPRSFFAWKWQINWNFQGRGQHQQIFATLWRQNIQKSAKWFSQYSNIHNKWLKESFLNTFEVRGSKSKTLQFSFRSRTHIKSSSAITTCLAKKFYIFQFTWQTYHTDWQLSLISFSLLTWALTLAPISKITLHHLGWFLCVWFCNMKVNVDQKNYLKINSPKIRQGIERLKVKSAQTPHFPRLT